MLNKSELVVKINQLRENGEMNNLIDFMSEKGFGAEEWSDLEIADFAVIKNVSEFFGDGEIALDKVVGGENSNLENDGAIDFEKMKQLKNETKNIADDSANSDKANNENSSKETGDNKSEGTPTPPTVDSKAVLHKKYKTIDNLTYLSQSKETVFKDVRLIAELMDDTIYSFYLNGNELASLWLDGTLTFDPTMQRGLKQDVKTGESHANFKDSHVREIYDSMIANKFTPTQLHFAIITDDEDLDFDYNSETKDMLVNGKVRNLDGQHRTRACVKIYQELLTGKLKDFDLDKYVFNIQLHATTAEYARIIYDNIDKNLKLDKSQKKQLSGDYYARIVNALNQNSDSPLKEKIATAKPVGNKLVLFSNLAEAIEKNQKITSNIQKEETRKYLTDFFDYVAYKIPQFADDATRAKFKENNLLVENNFFPTWIKVAFADKENYKANIDKIVENISFFNKDALITVEGQQPIHRWLASNTVKYKKDNNGFAMQNTSTGIVAMTTKTLELLGIQ
jgi:hypothetical protein